MKLVVDVPVEVEIEDPIAALDAYCASLGDTCLNPDKIAARDLILYAGDRSDAVFRCVTFRSQDYSRRGDYLALDHVWVHMVCMSCNLHERYYRRDDLRDAMEADAK